MTTITRLQIPDVLLMTPTRHGDERGYFEETYNARTLAESGFHMPFVQDNHARSGRRGVLRGLHFQRPPAVQAKLLRVAKGAIFDVAVDIRLGSPTFGRWVGEELSAENGRQLLVPAGFAHGYLTLTDQTDVLYKVTDYYAPSLEGGLLWSDPSVGIDWPRPSSEVSCNARDSAWPSLGEVEPLPA